MEERTRRQRDHPEGQGKKDPVLSETDLTARTVIRITPAGTYRLWIRSRDFEKDMPGRRIFTAAVNGIGVGKIFGNHGKESYEWQDAGVFKLPAGAATLEVIDVSQHFARRDRFLLTRDLDYVPKGPGGPANADHTATRAQPMVFAPVLGGPNSEMAAGDNFSFRMRLFLAKENCASAFETIVRKVYGFKDYRRNGFGYRRRRNLPKTCLPDP